MLKSLYITAVIPSLLEPPLALTTEGPISGSDSKATGFNMFAIERLLLSRVVQLAGDGNFQFSIFVSRIQNTGIESSNSRRKS